MKTLLLTLIFFVCGTFVFAGHNANPIKLRLEDSPNGIDQYDTVFFDLTNAVIISNYLTIPVFIKSDDVINSLDFSMKFDLSKLQYDSLLIHRPSMDPLANYNTNDSTLRLTSFDLSAIPNNTSLVSIRFKLLNGLPIHKAHFSALTALLNGDACTPVILESAVSSIGSIGSDASKIIEVYPNPSNGVIKIEAHQNAMVQLFDINGKQVTAGDSVKRGQTVVLNTENLPNGNYFIRAVGKNSTSTNKIVIISR